MNHIMALLVKSYLPIFVAKMAALLESAAEGSNFH